MKVQLYLGEEEEYFDYNLNKLTINGTTFVGFSDVLITYYPYWPDTGVTSTLHTYLSPIPSPYDNADQAANYATYLNTNYSAGTTGLTASHSVGETDVYVRLNSDGPIISIDPFSQNVFLEVIDVYSLRTNYSKIDTMNKEESINFTSKLSDIEKLSNVFTDFSDSFVVPASDVNNRLFKHYYNIDRSDSINANIKLPAYLEIDTIPYRYGTLQLDSVELENNRPVSYKVTFFGGLKQITELFGDDTLSKLDYDTDVFGVETKTRDNLSRYNYEYTSQNFSYTVNNPSFLSGDVITPLIAWSSKDVNYGTNDVYDISTTGGAIWSQALRPSLRINRILEAIEAKYGITFSREFFGKAHFNNLFMWLNEKDNFKYSNDILLENFAGTNEGQFVYDSPWMEITRRKYNSDPTLGYTFKIEVGLFPDMVLSPNVVYTAKIVDEDGNVKSIEEDLTGVQNIYFKTKSYRGNFGDPATITTRYKLVIETEEPLFFDDINVRVTYLAKLNDDFVHHTYVDVLHNGTFNQPTVKPIVKIEDFIPKMKVVDFISGLFKMWKLVIRPTSANSFYVNTIDGFYNDGNMLDIQEFTDIQEVEIKRPDIYNKILFKYQKTDNVLGKKFRELNDPTYLEIGYGDERFIYPEVENKNELKVELPFENMLFERLPVSAPAASVGDLTNIIIGQSSKLNDDEATLSRNKTKPMLFYYNGVNVEKTWPVYLKFGATGTASFVYLPIIGSTNDEFLEQVTDTLNFDAEIDPWHQQTVANSLYLNYWSNWVSTIYDENQRKINYKAILPTRYVNELSLNDRIIIENQRYKINDFTVNLTNGEAELNLFKDIYTWTPYDFSVAFSYTSESFAPSGWGLYSSINQSGTTGLLLGSFSGYGSTNYGHIIKLNEDLTVDTSFNSGVGFNAMSAITIASASTIYEASDGSIFVTGDFTSYSGVSRNRLVKLNANGSLHTGFTIGTGFDNRTTGIGQDSSGNTLVCGGFSSYSGISRAGLIRLKSNGSNDSTLSLGSGFNARPTSLVINSDDTMYVGGHFTAYSGVSKNRIVKLKNTGFIDTTFSATSTGFNAVTRILSDNNDGVIVYGPFTSYSGLGITGITRLNSDGRINAYWSGNTGFNGPVNRLSKFNNTVMIAEGTFTTYNGFSSGDAIMLNMDGSIYRTLSTGYTNYFTIGNKVYANQSSGPEVLVADESLAILSTSSILANPGPRYYQVDILKATSWTLTLVDMGYGTSWVEMQTALSGTSPTEVVFKIQEKVSQSAPAIYNPRFMKLRFVIDGITRDVMVTQNGLEQ